MGFGGVLSAGKAFAPNLHGYPQDVFELSTALLTANGEASRTLWDMNIEIQNIPSPSKLITTMDKHRFGAAMFVMALLICSLALVVSLWLYFGIHR